MPRQHQLWAGCEVRKYRLIELFDAIYFQPKTSSCTNFIDHDLPHRTSLHVMMAPLRSPFRRLPFPLFLPFQYQHHRVIITPTHSYHTLNVILRVDDIIHTTLHHQKHFLHLAHRFRHECEFLLLSLEQGGKLACSKD